MARSIPADVSATDLQQIARLIKADVGVEVAFADIGGWDTHVNEARQLGNNLSRLRRNRSRRSIRIWAIAWTT